LPDWTEVADMTRFVGGFSLLGPALQLKYILEDILLKKLNIDDIHSSFSRLFVYLHFTSRSRSQ